MENEEIVFENGTESAGLTDKDFKGNSQFLKNPKVNEELILNVVKVERSDKTTAVNKQTDKEFSVGLKQKDGQVKRYDIHCADGIYTIGNWEIFFKLFGNTGILMKYAQVHNGSFAGAKISIKRLLDGGYSSYKVEDLAKILGTKDLKEAQAYLDNVKTAIKEQRLFEVKEVQ